jgi:dynein heavy chain
MKVVQGVLKVPPQMYEALQDNKQKLLKLWIHESVCVYSDRLIDDVDKAKFLAIIDQALQEECQVTLQ